MAKFRRPTSRILSVKEELQLERELEATRLLRKHGLLRQYSCSEQRRFERRMRPNPFRGKSR